MKIKISLIDNNGKEKDFIVRDVPYSSQSYDFVKGLLIDLSLLMSRNSEMFEYYGWLVALVGKYLS